LLAFVLLVALFAGAALASTREFGFEKDDFEVMRKFTNFETKFHKVYSTSAERFHRLAIFAENLERVEKMNEEHGTPVFGVSKFMDLTPEEFKAKYLNLMVPDQLPQAEIANPPNASPDVTVWDWGKNKTGIITPVKNQEQCGSCWAFSATESVESAYALAGHGLKVCGPQQIVDCDTSGVDQGCNGGYPWDAFKYIIKAGGLESESAYPYIGVDAKCKFQASQIVANISSWVWVSRSASTEDTQMFNYVATTGPVSVCVDAAPWQYYTGGVLKRCGDQIDHAVQATGFSVQSGLNVWNVRNSWGADWGENGYIWLERGKNLCAIATQVTAAVSK